MNSPLFSNKKAIFRVLRLVLLATLALRVLLSVLSGAGQQWDFVNFYNTGSRVFHGEWDNIYRAAAPIAGKPALGDGQLEYTGFPLSAFVLAPLGAFRPESALVVFKAACVLFFALALWVLYPYFSHLLGSSLERDHALSLYLLLVLFFEPFWFVFSVGGQSTPLAFLFFALFAVAYLSGRSWISALCFTAAVLVKPFLGVAVVVFLLAGDWGFLRRVASVSVFAGALSWLLFGWQSHIEWAHIVLSNSARWAVPWWNNASILAFLDNFWLYNGVPTYGLIPVPPLLEKVQAVFRILLFVLLVWWVRTVRKGTVPPQQERHFLLLLAVLFPMFFSTVIWPHYLTFLFIPILFLVGHYRAIPRYAQVVTLLIFVLTCRANLTNLVWKINARIAVDNPLEVVAVGIFGSGALMLTLVFLIFYLRSLFPADRLVCRLSNAPGGAS